MHSLSGYTTSEILGLFKVVTRVERKRGREREREKGERETI